MKEVLVDSYPLGDNALLKSVLEDHPVKTGGGRDRVHHDVMLGSTGTLVEGGWKEDLGLAAAAATDDTRSVETILSSRVMDAPFGDMEAEDAFYVADMGEVVRQHAQWRARLPRVEPFYAVKCNPDANVVKTLVSLGIGFDCASKAEIQMVIDHGVDPSKVIYANPCKQASHIRYASALGVTMMTFDNTDELRKIKKLMPHAQLVLRILTDDSRSLCKLGLKFGASLETVPHLLAVAQELGLNLIGVSFHVGSGCFDANAFGDAVRNAAKVMEDAKSYGFNMTLLDVGGGFPGNNAPGLTFDSIVNVLGPAIDKYVPSHVRVIAEPGRYYVASAFTLAVNVVARRHVHRDAEDEPLDHTSSVVGGVNGSAANHHPFYMYYINDGMYGSFNCITFDHATVVAAVLAKDGEFVYKRQTGEPEFACSIWGPTCDSIDCITRDGCLPAMNVGDWLYFDNMGAYTMCAASQFNGFRKSTIVYTNTYED